MFDGCDLIDSFLEKRLYHKARFVILSLSKDPLKYPLRCFDRLNMTAFMISPLFYSATASSLTAFTAISVSATSVAFSLSRVCERSSATSLCPMFSANTLRVP